MTTRLLTLEEKDLLDQEDSSLNWKNLARMAGQGLTFGYSDEAIAKIRSMIGDEDYETLVQEERDAMARFKKEHPGFAYGTEIASSFLIPGAVARVGIRGGLAGAKGLGKLAGAGAAEGALYSSGVAEEGDRLGAAVTGAVAGSVLGPAVSKGGGAVARYAGRRLGRGGARRQGRHEAEKQVVRALGDDPQGVLSETQGAVTGGRDRFGRTRVEPEITPTARTARDDAMLADVPGDDIRRLAVGSTVVSGDAADRASRVLNARLSKEYDDLLETATDQMRLSNVGHRATALAEETAERTAQASQKWYKQAYGMRSLPMKDYKRILNNQKVQQAYTQLKDDMDIMLETEGAADGVIRMLPWKEFIKSETVSTQLIHKLKRELDDQASWGGRDPSIRVKPIRSIITAINKVTGELNPDYAKANQIFSIGPKVQEMVVEGADALKNVRPEVIARRYDKLGTFEKRAFRAGMLEELIKPMDRDSQKSFANYLNRKPELKRKLRATFGDDSKFNQFLDDVQTKIRYRQTKTDILRTSGTAERQLAAQSIKGGASRVGETALQLSNFNMGSALKALVGGLENKFVAEEIGRLLFTGSKGEAATAIKRLKAKRRDLSGQDRITLGKLLRTIEPRRQMIGPSAAITGSLLDEPRQDVGYGMRGLLPDVVFE